MFLNVVLCILSCGYCDDSKDDCSNRLCNSWHDYFHDKENCRSQGGVDKHTMHLLSFLPFGFSSFYRGEIFDGIFDISLGTFTLVSLLLRCCCNESRRNSDCSGTVIAWSGLIINISIIILSVVKIIICGEIFEIFVIPITLVLSCLFCCSSHPVEREKELICGIICFTTSMLLLEIIKHVAMAYSDYEVDASGCPLV